jgi:dihydroflavonol-4-reductase
VPPAPVLVTGGSGFVGGALLARLVEDGRPVRALVRSDASARVVAAAGAESVRGDVLDPSSLRTAMDGCAVVFHVAGVNATCQHDPRPMYRANIDGSANVIRAAAQAGVDRVVYTSSSATIGEVRGTIGREDSVHRGFYLTRYERSKHLAERSVLALAAELGVDVVCVNPSSVQGPGRTTGSARLLLALVGGRLPALVETSLSIVDVADCTEGHLLAESRGASGERYLVSGVTLTTREAVELARDIWGRPERVRWVRPGLVRAAGAAGQSVGRLLRRDVPVCREVVRSLLHGHRYDGSRAHRELGLRYTPVEVTLRAILEWYAERGLVPPPPSTRRPEPGP